ncbi:MAG: ACT domain-containing protein [Acidobacteriota bacterium]|nr:ACT domain-containing protein [Acidobacteriota bacterium]
MRLSLDLVLLPGSYAVCRLDPDAALPAWTGKGDFTSITRTPRETSVVCPQARVPGGVPSQRDFRVLRVQGTLDFSLTGVLDSMIGPLAAEAIAVFTISTYDTDYLLIRDDDLSRTVEILIRGGHNIILPE